MNATMWMGLLGGTIDRVKEGIRQRVAGLVVMAAGAIVLVCAVGFGLAAAHMWLSTRMADYLSALTIAAVLALVGLIVVVVGRRRTRAPIRSDVVGRVEQTAERARRETAAAVSSNVPSALVTALVLGIAAGLFRPKRKD